MKVAIWGGGKAGRHLFKEIREKTRNIEVAAFIDSNINDRTIDGIPLFKPDDFIDKVDVDAFYLAAGAQKAIIDMVNRLLESDHIYEIYMLHDVAGKSGLPVFNEKGEVISFRLRKILFSDSRPTLPYIEIPVVDNCNLNCKGCVFGINQNVSDSAIPAGQIISDLKRIKELFFDIPWIRILGGEPLLHPDLADIMAKCRELFPDSEIDLTTNGLLFPSLDQDLIDEIKNDRISVHVSGYEPTMRMIDRIEGVLINADIDYTIIKRPEFFKFYLADDRVVGDTVKTHERCPTRGCRELYKGKLLKCSAVIAFQHFNDQFGTHYEVTEGKDWFDLYSNEPNGFELIKQLNNPVPLCRYCDTKNIEKFDWKNDKSIKLEDYIIGK